MLSKNHLTVEATWKFERDGAQVKWMRWDQGNAEASWIGRSARCVNERSDGGDQGIQTLCVSAKR